MFAKDSGERNNRPGMGEYDHSIRDFHFIIGRFDIFNLSNKNIKMTKIQTSNRTRRMLSDNRIATNTKDDDLGWRKEKK